MEGTNVFWFEFQRVFVHDQCAPIVLDDLLIRRPVPRKADPSRDFVVETQFILDLRVVRLLAVEGFGNCNRASDGIARATRVAVGP